MSRLKKSRATEQAAISDEAVAVEWLNANVSSLAAGITDLHFAVHPELEARYGAQGRLKCQEDAAYHLHFLTTAIEVGSPAIFSNYVGWAKIMLKSRGIGPEDLARNLRQIKEVLSQRCSDAGHIINRYMDEALRQFPKMPESIPSYIDPRQPHADLANTYLKHLLLFDRATAIDAVADAVEKGLSIQDVFRYVLTPAQQEVGRLWQLNQITVIQEHYCTISADVLLMKLVRRYVGVPREVSAVTLCVQNEEHCLGVKLLSELLEADGWKVNYIGAKVPAAEVLRYLQKRPTDLMAISIGTPLGLAAARELIQAVRELPSSHRPQILAGGAALNSHREAVEDLHPDGYATTLLDGLEEANRLVRKTS